MNKLEIHNKYFKHHILSKQFKAAKRDWLSQSDYKSIVPLTFHGGVNFEKPVKDSGFFDLSGGYGKSTTRNSMSPIPHQI